MIRNGEIVSDKAWEKDTLAWKIIYFEERGKMLFCPNPNMYVDSTSIFVKYSYNDNEKSLKVISFEKNPKKPDTIPIQVSNFKNKTMQWKMIFYKDTIQMELKKENP